MLNADDIFDWIRREPERVLLIVGGAYLLVFLPMLGLLVGYVRLARRQARLLRGADGASLQAMLLEHVDTSRALQAQVEKALAESGANTALLRDCLQRVGVVRYDALPDVGGQQSFSIALLDAGGSGLVLSGLYSRQDVRVYAKSVVAAKSPSGTVALTEEEQAAIAQARPASAAAAAGASFQR